MVVLPPMLWPTRETEPRDREDTSSDRSQAMLGVDGAVLRPV